MPSHPTYQTNALPEPSVVLFAETQANKCIRNVLAFERSRDTLRSVQQAIDQGLANSRAVLSMHLQVSSRFIHRLPLDILGEIFLYLKQSIMSVLLVCRCWNSICRATPTLWDTLVMSDSGWPHSHTVRSVVRLPLAQNVPLHLVLSGDWIDELSVRGGWASSISVQTHTIWPRLRSVTLHNPIVNKLVPMFASCAANLTVLDLRIVRPLDAEHLPSLPNLDRLAFRFDDWTVCSILLAKTPAIAVLIVGEIHAWSTNGVPATAPLISLPSLTTLITERRCITLYSTCPMFQYLLRVLGSGSAIHTVGISHPNELYALRDNLTLLPGPILTLRVGSSIDDGIFQDTFHDFPHVTTLHRNSPTNTAHLTVEGNLYKFHAAFPNLRYLYIDYVELPLLIVPLLNIRPTLHIQLTRSVPDESDEPIICDILSELIDGPSRHTRFEVVRSVVRWPTIYDDDYYHI